MKDTTNEEEIRVMDFSTALEVIGIEGLMKVQELQLKGEIIMMEKSINDCPNGYHTYIFKDAGNRGYYKIGKSKDVGKRIRQLQCGNPNVALFAHTKEDIEANLHYIFRDKRHKGEWFLLSEEDLELALSQSNWQVKL